MKPKKPVRFKGGGITVLLLILCLSVSTTSAYMMASDSITTAFTIGEITPRISLAAELNEGIMVFPGTQLISSMFTVRAATGEVLDPSEYTLSPEIAPGTIGTFSLKVLPVGSKYRQAVVNVPNESPEHVLEAGPEFNSRIPGTATSIIFTDATAPSGTTVADVSAAKNGSVVSWVDGNTMYVSSQEPGAKIIGHKDMSSMFANKHQLSGIDVTLVDTSRATTFASMYLEVGYSAAALNIMGMDTWDTSNITNMEYMFKGAAWSSSSFNLGDIGNWDTSHVTTMYGTFMYTGIGGPLTDIYMGNLGKWDTSKVENMANMFDGFCQNATFNPDISSIGEWDVSSVTNMYAMFSGCSTIAQFPLNNWDTSNVRDMSQMFHSCIAFTEIDLSNWDTSNVVNMYIMFEYCLNAKSIIIDTWDTSNVVNMASMFAHAGHNSSTFTLCDIGKWDVSNVKDMSSMFAYMGHKSSTLMLCDLSRWNTSGVTNMSSMFEGTGYNAAYTLDLSSWDVSKVTGYCDFAKTVESKIILPNFS